VPAADLDQPGIPDREQQQDAPHQVMHVLAADPDLAEQVPPADGVRDQAGDAERDEERQRGEKQPLASRLTEIAMIECGKTARPDPGSCRST
jgi:hypothetical protein